MEEELMGYPDNMNIKTFTMDCFDGATETKEGTEMKEKYIKRFRDLSYEFIEDCIDKHIESLSQIGFFFGWIYPEFVAAQIDILYNHLHTVEGVSHKVYKFDKINDEKDSGQ